MTAPKYTDPAVQNKPQDEAQDYIDNLHEKPTVPAKEDKNGKNTSTTTSTNNTDKRKGYKEGNKDDFVADDDDADYDDIENDFNDYEQEDDEKIY